MWQQIIEFIVKCFSTIRIFCCLVKQSLNEAKICIILFFEKNGRIFNFYQKFFSKVEQVRHKEIKKLENFKRKTKPTKSDKSKQILENWFELK